MAARCTCCCSKLRPRVYLHIFKRTRLPVSFNISTASFNNEKLMIYLCCRDRSYFFSRPDCNIPRVGRRPPQWPGHLVWFSPECPPHFPQQQRRPPQRFRQANNIRRPPIRRPTSSNSPFISRREDEAFRPSRPIRTKRQTRLQGNIIRLDLELYLPNYNS